MTDNELNEMIKKAKSMINNNEVPDNIKNVINSLNNSQVNNTQNNDSFSEKNTNISNINMNNLMGLINNIQNSSDDNMSKLLLSLKPYLRDTKKEKIDDYIKLIQVGKFTKVMEDLNKNNK